MDDFDDFLDGLDDIGDDSDTDDYGNLDDDLDSLDEDLSNDFGDDNSSNSGSSNDSELSGFYGDEPSNDRPPVDKKRTFIIGGIGLGVILIVFIIAGFVKAHKDKSNVAYESSTEVSTQVSVAPQDSQVKTVETPVQQPVQQQVRYSDGWSVIEPDKTVNLDSEVSGVFTVTNIKHMARSNGVETEVKSVASGSISGLSGTYDIELPYSLARFVTVGNTLKLKYKIGQINGNSIISDLKVE
jgi:hypothetical protein